MNGSIAERSELFGCRTTYEKHPIKRSVDPSRKPLKVLRLKGCGNPTMRCSQSAEAF